MATHNWPGRHLCLAVPGNPNEFAAGGLVCSYAIIHRREYPTSLFDILAGEMACVCHVKPKGRSWHNVIESYSNFFEFHCSFPFSGARPERGY
jgi:hypothetical protein